MTGSFADDWTQRTALLWAGTVIGGSLIAAPAKFQVEDLTIPVALQVGRAQFFGITIAEILFLTAILGLFVLNWRKQRLMRFSLVLLVIVVVVLGVQHFFLMPRLQVRSDLIISGAEVGSSHLHVVYVVAECFKVLLLIGLGSSSFQSNARRLLAKRKKKLDRDVHANHSAS